MNAETWDFQVTNIGSHPIVALKGTLVCPQDENHPRTNEEFGFDSLVYGAHGLADQPILAGQTRSFPMPKRTAECSGGVDAVVYPDGRTEGSQPAAEAIYKRRRAAYEGLMYAKRQLDSVISSNEDLSSVASRLIKRAQDISQDSGLTDTEKSTENAVLVGIAHDLNGQNELNVPAIYLKQRREEVETIMKHDHVPEQKALAILLVQNLMESIRNLEGHTTPPP
jgi:hypothetical protein